MKFNTKKIEHPSTVLYGQRDGSHSFDAIMVLEHKNDSTEIHGFLTRDCRNKEICAHRETMTPFDLIALWKTIKKESRTQYAKFDVLKPHVKFYNQFLHVISSSPSVTIDGQECEYLTVDMSKGIKHFNLEKQDEK